jgi:hypothetical protein
VRTSTVPRGVVFCWTTGDMGTLRIGAIVYIVVEVEYSGYSESELLREDLGRRQQ